MPKSMPNRSMPYRLLLLSFSLFIIFAFLLETPSEIFQGILRIFSGRGLLNTDYFAYAGLGASLVNAAVSGIFCVLMMLLCHAAPNGALIMAICLNVGFAFFGKHLLNCWPIYLGVWLHARLQREPFLNYTLISLLSMTLGPIVSEVYVFAPFPPLLRAFAGIICGICIGLIMPVLTAACTKVHDGYNLYNSGFAGGLLALFVVAILKNFSVDVEKNVFWFIETPVSVVIFFYGIFILWILVGLYYGRGQGMHKNIFKIMKHSGRLVSDYYLLYGSAAFVNMGLLGILSLSVTLLLGAPVNGATLAAAFTMAGFGAFGKHLRNCIPLLLGGTAAAILSHGNVSDPSYILPILFSTGLAPIAGQYGIAWGLVAGALHVSVSAHLGQLGAGLNLYANGFAAGFVALLLLPLILSVRKGRALRKERKQDETAV